MTSHPKIPDTVTHYYLRGRKPFLSLSDLDGDISDPVFVDMLNMHKADKRYRRRYGKSYLKMRKHAESKLRKLFESRGGRPVREYPLYCVLGKSEWFRHLNTDHECLELAIADLPLDSVSLTYPDSFIAMTRQDKPYFEQIYFLNEIDDLVDQHGIPEDNVPQNYDEYWVGDFEKYIEVQIWDDTVIRPFLPAE